MSKVSASIYLDAYHPTKDGVCAVYIRVNFNRKRKYFSLGILLTLAEFKNAMYPTKTVKVEKPDNQIEKQIIPRKRTDDEKDLFNKLNAFEVKANEVIDNLPVFTFDLFEKMFEKNRGAADTISFAFDEYIKTLYQEDRVGTAMSYESAKVSLNAFRADLRFADITPSLLREYERWMYEKENGPTTVGIYLRSLRAIFNLAEIDKALYPFSGKNRYKIPASRNIKKALTLEDIGKIYNARLEKGSTDEMCRDYWMFIYLGNGLNVKDLCRLKYKNLDGDFIKFERAKTQRTKQEVEEIRISLKDDARAIIARWGQKSINTDTYIFPHLYPAITAVRERQLIQQLTQLMNKHMDKITKTEGIKMKVRTYEARHSFASVLKRSGASTEFISEALGHGDLKTTKSYLATFEDDTLAKTTDALVAFKI